MLKHKNSKIIGMILTRLITNPSMSLNNKNIRKNIGSIVGIIFNIKNTLDMLLGIL